MKDLANRTKNITSSLTLAITSRAKEMLKKGIDVINFAAGEPDFDTPDYIKNAAITAINEGFTKYTPASGIPELKEVISVKFKKDNELDYEPSAISISCGAKHSIYNIVQAICQHGDEVIIPSPYWISYPEMVRLAGAIPVFLKTDESDNFKLKIDSLKDVISDKTKILILNSPSNPTGSIYNKDELREIADIALSKKIYIISDEIYEKIIYDGLVHTSIASLNNAIKNLVLVVNGVSKSYSMTGWRIGYVAGPQRIIDAINKIQSHSTSNPCSISQKAALIAIRDDHGFTKKLKNEFEKRRDFMLERLNKIETLKVNKPQGAFYIFCNIGNTGLDSLTFANRLLDEAKIAVIPGRAFGSDEHIRLSFATKINDINRGIDRIEKWLKEKL